jgi:hypothetical protein
MRGGGGAGGGIGFGGAWFDRLDANHDGRISLDEAISVATSLFDRTDANHDGVITPEERQAARDAGRARAQSRGDDGGQ